MDRKARRNEIFESSHLIILVSYTVLSVMLIAESILMGWEKWALFLIALGVVMSWMMHLTGSYTNHQRMWLCSILMMCTYFFYGIHTTSTFDLAIVMAVVMTLYTITAEKAFINLCQVTYYITLTYAIARMIVDKEPFDSLVISRICLHVLLVFMLGKLTRTIIDKWSQVLDRSNEEIEELTDASERLNDFLANVSHELRTPVNAVIGLSGICIDKEEREDIKKDMVSVRDAGRKVAEQIGDILDYSEIDRNKVACNNEDYMLSSVLYDMVAELNPYKSDDIELIIDVDPAIPAVMNSDVSKLKKIMKLLITNSLKFTNEGGVYVRITADKKDYGVNLGIEVTDTGIGMTMEETERAFERFYQVDSGRSRVGGGLGLGLGIVQGFVSALGGFMTISSKPDVGTTVRVSVPQKVVDPSSCMSVNNKEKICIGGFLHFDKYRNPVVREYYNSMVRNIVVGLGVQMHRVDNADSLRRMLKSLQLTHLFVAEEEYTSARELLDSVADKIMVIVVANRDFHVSPGSNVRIMEKPFYCFPVATFLNMDVTTVEKRQGRFMCRGIRALVVDDEPMNLTVAKSIFRRYGMTVSTAASGFESVDMCAENEYDIVFMDHMMSGMDGVEAMKRIRSGRSVTGKDAPIVALTSNAMSSAKQMFLSVGFDGFVSKPIEREELERVLKAVLPKNMITYEDEEGAVIETEPEAIETAAEEKATDLLTMLRDAGVDTAKGIEYCQDDEEFYRELVMQFYSESAEKKSAIENAFASGDYKEYEIYVHALKSTAKMIGASVLSDMAKDLEMAAKRDDADFIQANHAGAMKEYKQITDVIAVFAVDDDDDQEILEFAPDPEPGSEDE
ncbi:Signal transduction histidine kinase [Ruminococcaceae bacterium YRB3002]|nr:Signal transduction histidine kinase [Ruminococcaceae bacterium YRB3002]